MTRKSSSVTIRDVAKYAGISVATVSRYINQNAPVSQEVSERISQVMMDLHYSPHVTARQLATRRTRAVGLLMPEISADFAPLFSGIESVVGENKYNLLVATCRPALRLDVQMPVGPHNVDGLLVYAHALDDEQLAQLSAAKFPVVLIHRRPPAGLDIPFVSVEAETATREIVGHLIAVHRRRRILLVRGSAERENIRQCEVGYRTALETHGIPVNERMILGSGFKQAPAGRTLTGYLSAGERDFDAVLASDAGSTLKTFAMLKDAGLRVPEDVSLAGFEDLPQALFTDPALTVVRAATEGVGRAAAGELFNLLRGQVAQDVTLVAMQVVLRHSCGCSI